MHPSGSSSSSPIAPDLGQFPMSPHVPTGPVDGFQNGDASPLVASPIQRHPPTPNSSNAPAQLNAGVVSEYIIPPTLQAMPVGMTGPLEDSMSSAKKDDVDRAAAPPKGVAAKLNGESSAAAAAAAASSAPIERQ